MQTILRSQLSEKSKYYPIHVEGALYRVRSSPDRGVYTKWPYLENWRGSLSKRKRKKKKKVLPVILVPIPKGMTISCTKHTLRIQIAHYQFKAAPAAQA
jgi:hypothetical protein